MKTIGIIGGMSWESTLEYYRILNECVKARLGGFHSAKCLLYSVDFAEFEALQMRGDWDTAAQMMTAAGQALERGGADFIIVATNTMHISVPAMEAALRIPILHIADAAAGQVQAAGLHTVGLLGTAFTMEQDFYRARLEQHGLRVLIPDAPGRAAVHRIIYEELVLGKINPESKSTYLSVISDLAGKGAQAIILGCTEIGLLVKQADTPLPLFDTTPIHAGAAVDFALSN